MQTARPDPEGKDPYCNPDWEGGTWGRGICVFTVAGRDYLYDYDGAGLLVGYTDTVDSGNSADYEYDWRGRRVLVDVDDGPTWRFVYDTGDDPVAALVDWNGNGSVDTTRVYWTLQDIDRRIGFVDIDESTGDADWYYYLTDQVGSVLAVVDADGDTVNRYDYDAYGNPIPENTFETVENRYRFHGREYDAHRGDYHYRHRTYIPEWGLFTSPDPDIRILDPNGACNYLFCSNNPTVYVDAFGLDYVDVDGGVAWWNIQEDGRFRNKDRYAVRLGRVDGDTIHLGDRFGGGTVSLDELRNASSRFWNEYGDMSNLTARQQVDTVSSVIERVRSGEQFTAGNARQIGGAAATGFVSGNRAMAYGLEESEKWIVRNRECAVNWYYDEVGGPVGKSLAVYSALFDWKTYGVAIAAAGGAALPTASWGPTIGKLSHIDKADAMNVVFHVWSLAGGQGGTVPKDEPPVFPPEETPIEGPAVPGD